MRWPILPQVLFCALLSAGISAKAQEGQLDSLLNLLKHHPAQDAEHLRLMNQAARAYFWIDPWKGERLADEAIALGRRLGDPSLLGTALLKKVGTHQCQGGTEDQGSLLDESIKLLTAHGPRLELAYALWCKAINISNLGQIDTTRALEYAALKIWKEEKDSVGEAWMMDALGAAEQGRDKALSDSLLDRALRLTSDPRNRAEYALALSSRAISRMGEGNERGALEDLRQAVQLFRQEGCIHQETTTRMVLAQVFTDLGSYQPAVEQIMEAMKVREGIPDMVDRAGTMDNSLGYVYKKMGDDQQALLHYRKAYQLAVGQSDQDPIVYDLNDIGELELKHGDAKGALLKFSDALRRSHDPKVELRYGKQAVDGMLALCYQNIGSAKSAAGDPAGAFPAFEEAVRFADRSGLWQNAANARNLYAKALLAAEPPQIARSIQFFRQVTDSAEANGWLNENRDALRGLSDAYRTLGDQAQALHYLTAYMAVKDSLLSAEKNRAISNLEILYDTEKKEERIVLLGKDSELQVKEISRQKLIRNGTTAGLAVVAGFLLLVFVQRNKIKREHHRSEELLLNILPGEVAEELKAKGQAEARQIDQVTVLFTDFKGFTAMSEKLSPKDLVRDIHECFSAFNHIMQKHGIEKIKTIGDAYMAAGGLPTPNNTHALDVVKAALEIRDFIADGKAHKVAQGLPYFEIRIGIHTGPVVAGIVGVKKFAYDIWGDTVNIASRMESSGEVGQVNISESTYALVKDEPGLTFTPRGKVQAKGKGEMEMYFVTNA